MAFSPYFCCLVILIIHPMISVVLLQSHRLVAWIYRKVGRFSSLKIIEDALAAGGMKHLYSIKQ